MENEIIPPDVQPAPVALPTKRPFPTIWLVAAAAILIGLVGLFITNRLLNAPPTSLEQIAQTPTPTPTPIRVLSAIATQSAFIALEQTQASLSSGLAATNLDDPSLSPPVLDLPLGFRQ